MKKNGKKYRKIQKELKRQVNATNDIDHEVDGIKTANLSMAHILTYNPISYDIEDTKREYFNRISKYLKIGGWNKRKYESSELDAYKKIVLDGREVKVKNPIDFYKYYILFDLIHILGYEIETISTIKIENVKKQYMIDFCDADTNLFKKVIDSVQGEDRRLVNLIKNKEFAKEKHYIELVRRNVLFRKQQPFGIMVTATMSAGKSTFINALVGKYICLSRNIACTSKIHSIINKAFEDGYSSEYDHNLVMTADREELLNDNEENLSDTIYVATNFYGCLSDSRIIVNDSPGVNFSGDQEHKKITDRLIKRRKYNLLIYVMNATQLGTNDDDEHLDYIKQTIGRTPEVFVINKVDAFNPDEEDLEAIIRRQTEYLKSKGFENAIVCPVSARAGYLAKQIEQCELSRSEERELYNYVDKFNKMKLTNYYSRMFPQIKIDDNHKEEIQLLKTCGMMYVEQLIKQYSEGGK